MDKAQGNKQAETKKKPKKKSKCAKREARLKKVRDEEIEMTELDQKILDVSLVISPCYESRNIL